MMKTLFTITALSLFLATAIAPANAMTKEECEKKGGSWVEKGSKGHCFVELKPMKTDSGKLPQDTKPQATDYNSTRSNNDHLINKDESRSNSSSDIKKKQ